MTRTNQRASQVLGQYYEGPPGSNLCTLGIQDSSNRVVSSCGPTNHGTCRLEAHWTYAFKSLLDNWAEWVSMISVTQ
eukprot:12761465-Prorocentrum_lima.AAC.1